MYRKVQYTQVLCIKFLSCARKYSICQIPELVARMSCGTNSVYRKVLYMKFLNQLQLNLVQEILYIKVHVQESPVEQSLCIGKSCMTNSCTHAKKSCIGKSVQQSSCIGKSCGTNSVYRKVLYDKLLNTCKKKVVQVSLYSKVCVQESPV